MEEIKLFSPLLQYGFAGFSMALLVVLVWMIRNLMQVLKDTSRIIDQNSEVIRQVVAGQNGATQEIRFLRDELLKRPCLAKAN